VVVVQAIQESVVPEVLAEVVHQMEDWQDLEHQVKEITEAVHQMLDPERLAVVVEQVQLVELELQDFLLVVLVALAE